MKRKLFILFVALTMTQASCKKNEEHNCGNMSFSEVSLSGTCQPMISDKATSDKFLVIRSLDELRAVLSFENPANLSECGSDSPIFSTDFSRHTLLIGRKEVQGIQASLLSQSVAKDCDAKSITYNALIKNGGYTAIGSYVFAVLIDRISDDTRINFNVKVSN